MRGWERCPATCASTIERFRSASATRTRSASTRRGSRRHDDSRQGRAADAGIGARDDRGRSRRSRTDAREPSSDGARQRPPRGPRSRQRGRRDQNDAGGDAAARRLHLGSRRPVRIAAALVPRVDAGVRHRHRARAAGAGRAVPRLHRVVDHPRGGAALARRRVRCSLADRHRPERVVGHGPDPARRARREERHRAARFRRDAAPGGDADARRHPRGGTRARCARS